jgi:hypothetical protein
MEVITTKDIFRVTLTEHGAHWLNACSRCLGSGLTPENHEPGDTLELSLAEIAVKFGNTLAGPCEQPFRNGELVRVS